MKDATLGGFFEAGFQSLKDFFFNFSSDWGRTYLPLWDCNKLGVSVRHLSSLTSWDLPALLFEGWLRSCRWVAGGLGSSVLDVAMLRYFVEIVFGGGGCLCDD